MITSKRLAPGMYEVTDGTNKVEVFKNMYWDGPGWVALSGWNVHTVTDPVKTKRQAMIHAEQMLDRKMKDSK